MIGGVDMKYIFTTVETVLMGAAGSYYSIYAYRNYSNVERLTEIVICFHIQGTDFIILRSRCA